MTALRPNYPNITFSFDYRGWKIELDRSEDNGQIAYSAWANNVTSSVVAVPYAASQKQAIRQAKRWVDGRLSR
ncbi:MAG: hypothetical protein AAF716_19390 [Cyanobacteria bacterium P01_D01_bin.1]